MELDSTVFINTLSPLAMFVSPSESDHELDTEEPHEPDHMEPALSDHHRVPVDGPTSARTTSWRSDGIDIDGVRFFAVPTFALHLPPLRVDVYIPPVEDHSNRVRHILKPGATMYTTNRHSATTLPISEHIVRALDHWSSSIPDFESIYLSVPFGSRVIVPVVSLDPLTTASDIQLVPNYSVEQAMTSLDALQSMWPSDIAWPSTIDTTDLHLRFQIHEAITIVTIPSSPHPSRDYVFKSLLRDQKYLYNELKMLLTLPAHDCIIPRPLYIVTHKCRFGGKRGVAGFILEYYPLGSLAANLPSSSPSLPDRFRWARQITSALVHINSAGGFYPDLKPDNVVLRQQPDGSMNAVLLDLEQRGGWFSWSPPEIAYVEYMEILASRAPDDDIREEALRLLRDYIPDWTPPVQKERYRNVSGGFSAPWLALAAERRDGGELKTLLERAQTFMLGKLLWCLFESRAAVRCGIDQELLRDPDPEFGGSGAFPDFKETPKQVRELITACTAGAPEWEGRRREVVLRDGRLVPASWNGETDMPSAEDTRKVVKDWWVKEVDAAKDFLNEVAVARRQQAQVSRGVIEAALKRPLLQEVLDELTHIEGR